MVKKTALSELPGPSASTLVVAKVNPDDQLLDVLLTDGKQDILLASAGGMGIRFPEEEVRPMGLVAAGVMGMKLATIDEIIGCAAVQESKSKQAAELLLVTANGSAKRISLQDFPQQGRYGQGVIVWKLTRQNRLAGMAYGKSSDRVILHFNRLAAKNIRLDEAPLQNRSTQGKPVQELKPGDAITMLGIPRQFTTIQPTSTATAKPEQGPKPTKASPPAAAAKAQGKAPEKTAEKPAKKATVKPAVTKKTAATPKTATGKTAGESAPTGKTAKKPAYPAKKTPAAAARKTPSAATPKTEAPAETTTQKKPPSPGKK